MIGDKTSFPTYYHFVNQHPSTSYFQYPTLIQHEATDENSHTKPETWIVKEHYNVEFICTGHNTDEQTLFGKTFVHKLCMA